MQWNWGKNKGEGMDIRHTMSGEGKKPQGMFLFTIKFYVNFFHKSGSFTFSAKDLFSQIQGFKAQNCKIHISKTVSSLQNITLVLVLDHERCA